jgi:NADH-quinone oxidoreductase subunit N
VSDYALLIPELLLVVGALWALFAERLPGKDRGSAWVGAGLSSCAVVAAIVLPAAGGGPFGSMLAFDGPARFARVAIALLTTVWLVWSAGRAEGRMREAVSLVLFSAVGCMLVAEARELVTLLLSLELATMPVYVLVGYRRGDVRALEGAIKYFLMSMLTTLVMLYGFSFLYGLTGTTHYAGMDLKAAGAVGVLAVLLSLIGLFAKLSAAPFHYWAPDAYSGATPWAVAYVSTVPKIAGAVAAVRFVSAISPGMASIGTVIAVVAFASMVLGNLAALTQTDLRRMFAYSGVAHSGYLLIGVAALSRTGFTAAILYAVAYALPSMGVMLVAAEEGPNVEDFNGLSQRRPPTSWGVVLLLLSLIGVPPMIGFFGKFNLLIAGQQRGLTVLVITAVIVSVVSAGYYLRIVRGMFFGDALASARGLKRSVPAAFAFGFAVVATLAAGLAAGPVLAAIGAFLK